MNNSMILLFISRVYAFFQKCYNGSLLKKGADAVVSFLKKITANSFFINFFATPVAKAYTASSKIFTFSGNVLKGLRKLFSRVAKPIANSGLAKLFTEFYSNLLDFSLRIYGIFAATLVVIYSVFSIIGGAMTSAMSAFAAFVVLISVICCSIDESVYNIFTGSILVKISGKLLDKHEFERRDVVGLNAFRAVSAIVCGAVLAFAALLTNPVYTLLFVFAIVALGWIVYDYSVGIYIAVVMLPFLPTMALVGMIMFTFASFVIRFVFDEKMTFKRTPLDVPLLLFAIVLVISAITSFAVKSSVMAVMVYLAFILSYFLITNSIKTKQRFYSLIVLVLFAGVLVAAYGIYQHIFGFAEGTVWTDTDMFSDIETRVVSTFENPNVLGEYLLLLIPVGLGVVWGAKQGYNKILHLAIVGALSLCMIYTYSRGNWIGLIVAVFMFFMFYDRRFVWLGVIALLISPVFLPQNVINRFLSVGDMGDTSTSYRVYIWMGTLNMLKDYWFSGIGVGTEAFNRIYPLYSFSGVTAPHSHNLYLQIITENGILGLVVFISVMAVYFKMCVSSIIKAKDRLLKGIITGLAAGMLGYLVQGMFDNVWYNYRVFLLFFVILGITSVCIEISGKHITEEVK